MCVNLTLVLAFPFNGFSQEQVLAPTYKDGDFWVFRVTQSDRLGTSTARLEGDYQVYYTSGGFRFFQLSGGEKVEMTPTSFKDWWGSTVRIGSISIFSFHYLWAKNGLENTRYRVVGQEEGTL